MSTLAMPTKSVESREQFSTAFDIKAEFCATLLKEGRRLAAMRSRDPLLNQILARAHELIDELDELLVGLHPARDREDVADALHREFDAIRMQPAEPH